MKKNITYIISNIDKAIAFEWIVLYIDSSKFNLNFILLNAGNSYFESFLKEHEIPVERISYHGKKHILSALIKIVKSLKRNKSDCIHTHLFDAGLIGLTAGWLAGVKKRIYTRHHSDYHHSYHPHAVKYDRYINALATNIIAISKVVQDILLKKEGADKKKITLIHHGFLLKEFMHPPETSLIRVKQAYNPQQKYPVIGLISRYSVLKGIQYCIPAFKQLLNHYPNALLVLANAKGDYTTEIKKLLSTIPPENVIEISFERDIFALYKLFDVFVHVPIASEIEAFGQTYVEALISEIPSVFTLSGIAHEFIINGHNALVVPYKDSLAIFNAISELLVNKNLAAQLGVNGKKDVLSKFDLNNMVNALEELYER